METKRLFNWEVEKKIKELEGSLQFKEVTMVDLQEFILQHNYYNGESDEVFVYLCNAYFDRYATYEKAELLGPFLELKKLNVHVKTIRLTSFLLRIRLCSPLSKKEMQKNLDGC